MKETFIHVNANQN